MSVLIAFAYIFGYIFIGVMVSRSLYAHSIEPEYRRQLAKMDSWTLNLHVKRFGPATKEEVAYKQAKLNADPEFLTVPAGVFWPIGIIWLITVKLNKAGVKLVPRTVIEKEIDQARKRLNDLHSVQEAIKLASAAGMELKELKEIERSLKSQI